MHSRTNTIHIISGRADINCFNIPIECIRKTRCLNIDRGSGRISREVYKILKSNNGRKIFTPDRA